MPTLAPTRNSFPPKVTGSSRSLASVLPTRAASARVMGSSRITENSSPPVRATVSDRRTRPVKRSPTCFSSSSPV